MECSPGSEYSCLFCISERLAAWKEAPAVVELGLWAMLSTSPTVNKPGIIFGGNTTPSVSNFWHTLLCQLKRAAHGLGYSKAKTMQNLNQPLLLSFHNEL